MNRRGFTLIELLGVIILLALLIVLGSTSVAKSIKQAKINAYNLDIDSFVSITKNWALNHTDDLPGLNSSRKVTLQDLINSGLVEAGKINPVTNQAYNLNMAFCIYNTNNNYRYEYKESGEC